MRHPAAPALLLALLAALAAAASVGWATAHGVGVFPDSTIYLEGARHIASGAGWISSRSGVPEPVTHWPPLYPALLALPVAAGLDVLVAARALALLFAAATVLLAAALVWQATRAAVPAAGAALLVALAPDLLASYAAALSEPLFLVLLVAALALLARALAADSTIALLAAASIAGASVLVRYPGITVVGTGALAVLVFGRGAWRRRVGAAAGFGLVACAPLALWLARNALVGGSATNRALLLHPVTEAQLRRGAHTVAEWLPIPGALGGAVALAAVAAAVGVPLVVALRPQAATRGAGYALVVATVRVTGLFLAVYAAFLLAAISLLDAATPLDARLLAPGYVAAVLCAITGWSALAGMAPARLRGAARGAFAAGVALLAAAQAWRGLAWTTRTHAAGIGYARAELADFGAVDVVRAIPADRAVYSNVNDFLAYRAERPVLMLPKRWDSNTRLPNPTYAVELDAMRAAVRAGGRVVLAHGLMPRDYLPDSAALAGEGFVVERHAARWLVMRLRDDAAAPPRVATSAASSAPAAVH